VLVEGPVVLAIDDGSTVYSERFAVAVCTCRRHKRVPLCTTIAVIGAFARLS
jgi:hypothetical protein